MQRAFVFIIAAGALSLFASCANTQIGRGHGRNESGSAVMDLKNLYEAHRWFDLGKQLEDGAGPLLFRGAVAAVFARQDEAETLLRGVINTAPQSEEAHQAYELLAHLSIQTGQYARLAADMQQRLKDFPEREEVRRDHAALGPLLHLPNQLTARTGFAILKHNRDLFSPMTINGQPAAYFFDSGAGVSAMSESEAKRLGMEINDDAGKLATSTGQQTSFRTAVAKDFKWGAVELKNVSFAVFRDDQEPWKDLPAGRRGLIGIPALVATQRVRWSRDGTVEVGVNRGAPMVRQPNLCLDDDQLFTSVTEQGHTFPMRLDTGAVYTELWARFAEAFPELIRNKGTKIVKDVHGVGHAEEMEAVSLARLQLGLGGRNVTLRPALVLLKQPGPKRCWGNVGMDLLKQAPAFAIDFRTMTLELEMDRHQRVR